MNQILNQISLLPRRDQWALLICCMALGAFLVWIAFLSPLQKKAIKLNETNLALEQSLGRVQLLVQQIQQQGLQAPASSPISGEGISAIADASLREVGLTMSSFTPGVNGEARVRVERANSSAMLQWVYDLENKHHVVIRELSVTALNDPGQVSISARLVKP